MARNMRFGDAVEAISKQDQEADQLAKRMANELPVIRALEGSLQAIRDVDTSLVDDWGAVDRMEEEFTAVNSDDTDFGEEFQALRESIREFGQQVPALLRPSAKRAGRYEIIYGRRRLRACVALGVPLRANVQELDDNTALLAKSVENAARRPLSFYEKVRFSGAIIAEGQGAETVMQLLSISKSAASHLKRIRDLVPVEVGDAIGAAPKSGRPRWTRLADAFQAKKYSKKRALEVLAKAPHTLTSDERLSFLIQQIPDDKEKREPPQSISPVGGVKIQSDTKTTRVSIEKSGEHADFGLWLDANLNRLIDQAYQQFNEEK